MWVFLLLMFGLLVASLVLANEVRKAPWWQDVTERVGRAWRALTTPPRVVAPGGASILSVDEPLPAPAPPRGRRWCAAGGAATAAGCQPRRAAERTPRSTILPRADENADGEAAPITKPTSGFILASRPGVLVEWDAYESAPPLPNDDAATTWSERYRTDRSVEIDVDDLEELVDTQPSIVLSPAEAAALREAAHRYDQALEDAAQGEEEGRITQSDVPVQRKSALPPPPASSHEGSRKSALPLPPPSSRGNWDKRATQPRPTPRLDEILQEAPTGPGRLVRDEADDTQPRRALAG